MKEWKALADENGYLDWEGFSTGLARALEADSSRLLEMKSQEHDHFEKQSSSLQRGIDSWDCGISMLRSPVEAEEIEWFLSRCSGETLVQTLARMRKEVYRHQRAQQQQSVAAAAAVAAKSSGSNTAGRWEGGGG